MGSFIEHSYKVLYEPDAEVECITVCDKKVNWLFLRYMTTSSPRRFSLALEVWQRPTFKAREKHPGDEVG